MKNCLFINDINKVGDEGHSAEAFLPCYSAIELVYVLSGRSSALKIPVDNPNVADTEDDYNRLLHGITIAKQVFAARGTRIPIFYNGRALHNEHLRLALEQGIFDYPKELFIIAGIKPDNTIGQTRSFQHFLEYRKNPLSVIAIVSSAYHLPRAARTFNKDSPTVTNTFGENKTSQLEKTFLIFFGIDKKFARPGVEKDISGEIEAMEKYSSGDTPSISRFQGDNTFLNDTDILMSWSFTLQKQAKHLLTNFRSKQECKNTLKKIDFK